MGGRGWPFGQAAASTYLRVLLTRPDLPYRLRWARHAQRSPGPGEINVLAVARLLVAERRLWPGVSDPAQVKDVFYRALAGDSPRAVLSPVTLGRFVEGFEFSADEERQLRALLAGVEPGAAQPVTGVVGHVGAAPPRPAGSAPMRDHETVSLHELHFLGPDGLPERHTTVQVVRANVDDFGRYFYRIDTDRARVEVRRGGYVKTARWLDSGLFEFEIALQRALRAGETAAIQYDTIFSYDPAAPPPPEFRRGALGRVVSNLEMYVQFHRSRMPRRVWWAEWDDYREGAGILHQERVWLDAERAAHRFMPFIDRTVVGFHWEY